jgi:Domain of unknown function (DUF4287)
MNSETEYEFLFVVDGVSIDDDQASIVLADNFDAVLSWNRGVHRLAISSSGRGAIDALLNLLPGLTSALPRLKVLRLDPDLVGVSDIAQRTGRTRQSVQLWVAGERNASRPFPLPEGSAGRAPVWRWADVDEWLKPLSLDDHSAWPTRAESTCIDAILLEREPEDVPLPPASSITRVPGASTQEAPSAQAPVSTRGVATAVLSAQETLVRRISLVTGTDLPEWFSRLERGPAFSRREERVVWLADEYGIADRYASAIVREYEVRRGLRLFDS